MVPFVCGLAVALLAAGAHGGTAMSDIIVIGGGVAGLSVAARLAPHANVTVLEAEDNIGYHASGRSAALFEANYGAPTTVTLSAASAEFHHTAHGGYTTPRGLMLVAPGEARGQFDTDLAYLKMHEIPVAEAMGYLPILNPDAVAYAGYHAEAWDLDTDRMLQDFRREIRQNGGALITRARVETIAYDARGWTVRWDDEARRADMVINAAGAWADQIALQAGITPIGLTPLRRSMARLPAPQGRDVSRWPMVIGAGEQWYGKPDAGAWIVSPADEDLAVPHDAWPDDMVLAEGLARYAAMVTAPVDRVIASWAGLRTFSPDRALTIGRDAAVPSFFWVAGQGGYGFQTAPAASQLAADLILGRAPDIDQATVAALSPHRFG